MSEVHSQPYRDPSPDRAREHDDERAREHAAQRAPAIIAEIQWLDANIGAFAARVVDGASAPPHIAEMMARHERLTRELRELVAQTPSSRDAGARREAPWEAIGKSRLILLLAAGVLASVLVCAAHYALLVTRGGAFARTVEALRQR